MIKKVSPDTQGGQITANEPPPPPKQTEGFMLCVW